MTGGRFQVAKNRRQTTGEHLHVAGDRWQHTDLLESDDELVVRLAGLAPRRGQDRDEVAAGQVVAGGRW